MLRLLALALFLAAPPLAAQEMTEVDVELVLAVDVSRSMSPHELEIQRKGYAAALTSDEVNGAIGGGMIGRIAVTYIEWAGTNSQTVIVPWTLIETPEQAAEVARTLSAFYLEGMRRTSISEALVYAAGTFETNRFQGLRRVIDISGDGPNNMGRPVLEARDEVVGRGIVINGLPLMTQDDFSSRWGIEDLDAYYRDCVIGGPGAFMIPVSTWDLDLAHLRQTAEALDAVERAWLQVRSGGVLEVRIEERVPVMIWRNGVGLDLVDATGHRVARLATRAARPDLPLIAGEGAPDEIAEARLLWAAAGPLHPRLRGLVRVGQRRWDMVLDRGQLILLPAEGALGALERVVALDSAQQLLSRDVVAVDMRNPARPTLRLTADAMSELTRNRTMQTGAVN